VSFSDDTSLNVSELTRYYPSSVLFDDMLVTKTHKVSQTHVQFAVVDLRFLFSFQGRYLLCRIISVPGIPVHHRRVTLNY